MVPAVATREHDSFIMAICLPPFSRQNFVVIAAGFAGRYANAITACLLCTWDAFHKWSMISEMKSCQNSDYFNSGNSNPIRPQICTCHNSFACCVMCKIVSWLDHHFKGKSYRYFDEIWMMSSWTFSETGQRYRRGNIIWHCCGVYITVALTHIIQKISSNKQMCIFHNN